MRKYWYVIAFAVLLALAVFSGCAKRQSKFGNVANVESVELVQDAMSALLANYSPAKTRFALVRDADDAFGSALAESMRAHGYAVAEYSGPRRSDKYQPIVEKPDGLAFAYLVDRLGNAGEIRVSLHIGAESLSRSYLVQEKGGETRYIPQGFWSRRINGGAP